MTTWTAIALLSAGGSMIELLFKSWSEVALLLFPPFTFAVAFLAIVWLGSLIARLELPPLSYLLIFAFMSIGLIPGVIAGYSQQPVIATFVTATVGVVSTLIAIGFAKDSLEDYRPAMPLLIIGMLFGALVGFSTGGIAKHKWLRYDQMTAQRAGEIAEVHIPLERMRQEENFRRLKEEKEGMISKRDLADIK